MCKKGSYCSPECENKRSIPHIFTCSKRAITTADYLYMDILHDELPKDPDVMKDFCFDRCSFADQSKLLGLYKGFLRILQLKMFTHGELKALLLPT